MNVNPPKGEWQQFRDGQWGKLSDVDLATTVELVGRLQKWYQKAEGDVAPENEGASEPGATLQPLRRPGGMS